MKVISLIAILLSLPAFGGEAKHSIGLGLQYGTVGYQLAHVSESVKYQGSIGLGSAGLGIQWLLDQEKKHALGVNLGVSYASNKAIGLTYNHYFKGVKQNGWTIGSEVGQLEESDTKKGYVSINIGYQFN